MRVDEFSNRLKLHRPHAYKLSVSAVVEIFLVFLELMVLAQGGTSKATTSSRGYRGDVAHIIVTVLA
jgi:hypothetical protein